MINRKVLQFVLRDDIIIKKEVGKNSMQFEWDDEKDRKNIVKHGIPFRTAILVFSDPDRIEKYDDIHSLYEDRYLTIGEIGGTFMVVTVVYTERPEAIRIISARRATRVEKEEYYGYQNNA